VQRFLSGFFPNIIGFREYGLEINNIESEQLQLESPSPFF
jgi:hypothetical protein